MKIVGIAGGSASGKTTLARALHRSLGESSALLTHDRYYRTMPDAHRDAPVGYNFDHPDALDTPRLVDDLRALRIGQDVRLPRYDFARHERLPVASWEVMSPPRVLIVEGILVLADPDLRACYDHTVFVHTPADIRLARRIRRDMAERGRDVDGILAQYEATVRPMHIRFVEPSRSYAALVVDGTHPIDHLVALVIDLIA